MFVTNLILAIAFILMIAVAIWLFRSSEGGSVPGARREQVRIVDSDEKKD
ncbi:hypothetical protein [Thiohalocapsa sp. ML1]|jgi:hypothetical protein|nr:hypothetical protein [Thiohalocapsa sp. ML1]